MSKRHRGFIENYQPRAATVDLIERVQAVLRLYAAFLPLTIRQIFYRLVGASDEIIGYEKTERAYKRLAEAIGKARRGGLIDFNAIRDDGVMRIDPSGYDGIDHLMAVIRWRVDEYRLNRQIGQPTFTIMACEAAGMAPQLAHVAAPFGVSVISGGGFDSVTAKHDLAKEIAASERPVRLLHIGDYDPSGVHLFSSLDEDVRAFLMRLNPNVRISCKRVAILPEHVARFRLQTAPAKTTDNCSFDGIGADTRATVQAEALSPSDLATLVEAALRNGWGQDVADRLAEREGDERERLRRWFNRSLRRSP